MSTISISGIAWGEMKVRHGDRTLTFKDCKVWPGGAKAWDWNETGTRHVPGTQPADIEELIEHEIEVMIVSRGMQLVLQTSPETIALLDDKKIEHHILETKEAVKLFNELTQQGRRVAGIFHSTC